jgi:bromodomain-containing protein 7
LEHIAKAAPTVIQYEADWNIDIENDEDPSINVEDDDAFTPQETGPPPVKEDSPPLSVQFGGPRRSTRAPPKPAKPAEKDAKTLSESIDAEGRLPGSKEGLGAFPPGSDWSNMMLALKIKGVYENLSNFLATEQYVFRQAI